MSPFPRDRASHRVCWEDFEKVEVFLKGKERRKIAARLLGDLRFEDCRSRDRNQRGKGEGASEEGDGRFLVGNRLEIKAGLKFEVGDEEG